MPVKPEVQVLLNQLKESGFPALEALSPADARAAAGALAAPGTEPVARIEDRTVPGPAGPIPVRIYIPEGPAIKPVLVYFHGGGWVIGNITTTDAACRSLANQAGCVVVSVDYRLAPEHKFPAAPEDCYAAVCWVAENAAALGVNPGQVAVGGDSAGGNLAAVVSLMARDRGGPAIGFQLLVYPVTDYNLETASYQENAEGYFLTRSMMAWFWQHYLTNEAEGRHWMASPLRAESLQGLPPALVITAEFDPLRDEGEAYAQRLEEAGVPVVARRYPGMIHAFFTMPEVLSDGKAAIAEAAGVLRRTFAQ
jgi:acetyl esterase